MTVEHQLTYTSVDALRGGRGGWQVKDTTTGLTPAQERRLLELVATRLDPPAQSPRFPSLTEISALPQRLLVQVDPDGTAFVVHSSPAGNDASGRPGNVFNHALVVEDAVSVMNAGGPRPIQWWGSSGWLRPYGADAVRAAVPPLTLPVGAAITRESVASFLTGCPRPALGALLDATAQALAGGPRVVLVLDDQEEGVRWLGAVSFLTPPATHTELSLSTFERTLGILSGPGALLTVVPLIDLPTLTSSRTHVVIEPGNQRQPADGEWAFTAGTAPEGPWSRLGSAVASLPVAAVVEVLSSLDYHAASSPRAAAALPLWPLAMALSLAPHKAGAAESAEVLAGIDIGLIDDAGAREHRRAVLVSGAGATSSEAAASAADAIAGPGPITERGRAVYLHYVELAVIDDALLLGPWPPYIAPLQKVDAQLRLQLQDAIARALVELPVEVTDLSTRTVLTLRLMDFAHLVGADPLPAEVDAITTQAAQLLRGRLGPEIVTAAGALDPVTVARMSTQLAALTGGLTGQPLDDDVTGWLSRGADVPMVVPTLVRDPIPGDHIQHALDTMLRDDWMPGGAPAQRAATALAAASDQETWTAAELTRVVHALGTIPDLDVQPLVEPLLAQAPFGEHEAMALAAAVLEQQTPARPMSERLRALAELHTRLRPGWWRTGPDSCVASVELLLAGMEVYGDVNLPTRELEARLRPPLLAAALRTAVWRRELAARPDLSVELRDVAIDVLQLSEHLQESLEPTLSMLRNQPELAAGLVRASVQADLGVQDGPEAPLAALLAESLQPDDAKSLGGERLGRALTAQLVRDWDDAEHWLTEVVQSADVPEQQHEAREAWRRTVLDAVGELRRSIET